MRATSFTCLVLLAATLGCSSSEKSDHPSDATVTRDAVTEPPGSLAVASVPQFVVIGNDDNAFTGLDGLGGLQFLMDTAAARTNPAGNGNAATFDGAPVRFSMYVETDYIGEQGVGQDSTAQCKTQWRAAYDAGAEIGLHTQKHLEGGATFTTAQWEAQITPCEDWVTKPWDAANVAADTVGIGVPAADIWGFRAPYLAYDDALFEVLKTHHLRYDCSIQEGFQADQDGTNYVWPYTLHDGAPGDATVGNHPGLWELPVYAFLVPPDDQCAAYGVPTGLRAALALRVDPAAGYDPAAGKITGLDYNLWADFHMTPAEFTAVLEYTLDRRLAGNRAPFTIGTHTDLYHPQSWDTAAMTGSTADERMQALTAVIDYALAKPEVRMVRARDLVTWLEQPTAL